MYKHKELNIIFFHCTFEFANCSLRKKEATQLLNARANLHSAREIIKNMTTREYIIITRSQHNQTSIEAKNISKKGKKQTVIEVTFSVMVPNF